MSHPETYPRFLPGPWPLVSRLAFVLALIANLFLLLAGISPYEQSYTAGYIGVNMPANEAGEVVLEVHPDTDAEYAGLASGDVLLSIDGQPPRTTEDERYEQIGGRAGEPVTVTVHKSDGTEPTYTIVRSSVYFNNITAAGLTTEMVGGYFATLAAIVGLTFAALGAILLLRPAQDWLFVLAGFTLLFFPYSLNAAYAAYYGAYQTNLNWMYQIIRAAGLFLTCLLLFVFPNGVFAPRWTRWATIVIAVWIIPYLIALWVPGFLPGIVLDITWMVILTLAILLQVYRQGRISTLKEKQIARPMVVGAVVALVVYLFFFLASRLGLPSVFSGDLRWWYHLTAELVLDAALLYFGFGLVRSLREMA